MGMRRTVDETLWEKRVETIGSFPLFEGGPLESWSPFDHDRDGRLHDVVDVVLKRVVLDHGHLLCPWKGDLFVLVPPF